MANFTNKSNDVKNAVFTQTTYIVTEIKESRKNKYTFILDVY